MLLTWEFINVSIDKCEIRLAKPLKYQNIKKKRETRRCTHIPRGS